MRVCVCVCVCVCVLTCLDVAPLKIIYPKKKEGLKIMHLCITV